MSLSRFSFAVESTDGLCGGGVDSRRKIIEKVSTGLLSDALHFVRSATKPSSSSVDSLDFENREYLIQSLSLGDQHSSDLTAKTASDSFRNLMPSGLLKLFKKTASNLTQRSLATTDARHLRNPSASILPGNKTLPDQQACDAPVWIICSRNLHGIPWELLLSDINIVRGIGLLAVARNSLASKQVTYCPSCTSHPVYFRFGQTYNGLSSKQFSDLKLADLQRRAKSALKGINGLSPFVSSVAKSAKSILQHPLYTDLNSSAKSSAKSKPGKGTNASKSADFSDTSPQIFK